MSTPIPPPLRAAAGLAALAIDSARKVPQQLVGLPVLAVSSALQASLKAQQAYAGLVARGDEVLGQLRGQQDAPWATFDDEPAGARPPSAFDAAPYDPVPVDVEPAADLAVDLAVELAAVDLSAVDPDSVEDLDRALDPDFELDVVADAALAQAVADADDVLGELEEDELAAADAAVIELEQPSVNGQAPSTEPGVDLPAGELGADAAAAGTALAGDGYLAEEPPIPGYDDLSIPQLRGRLRSLTTDQVEALIGYERVHAARPPYLTMLENRLTTLRSR